MGKMKTITNPLTKKWGADKTRMLGGPDGLLATMRPFKGNSVSAERSLPDDYLGSVGRLSSGWANQFRGSGFVYSVWSWATPIAWVTEMGDIVIPPDTYSVTTTYHQNACRAWLNPGHFDMLRVWKMIEEGDWA